MSAYPPPLFSFSTLKFNRLIYEVADVVASTMVNVLSIITNKIFTYDVNQSRELWCDSDVSPINIGSLGTTAINIGSSSNINQIGDILIEGFKIDSVGGQLNIGDNSTLLYIGANISPGDTLVVGNATTSFFNGGFEFIQSDIRASDPLIDAHIISLTTANVLLGEDVDSSHFVQIGSSLCEVYVGNYIFQVNGTVRCTDPSVPLSLYSDSASLTIGDSSNYIYFGQAQILGDAVYIGNQNNTNYLGGFRLDNQTLVAQVPTDPVLLFKSNQIIELGTTQVATNTITIGNDVNTNYIGGIQIDNQTLAAINPSASVNLFNADEIITLGTSQVATNTLTIGSSTNSNKVGNFNFIGDAITSSSISTNVTLMNNLTTGTLSIGTSQTSTANLNLGSATSTILCGTNFRFQASALTSSAVSSAITFYNNITTGSLTLLGSLTSAFVNIGGTAVTTGGLRLYNAITMGYTTLITPTVNQVGYIQTGTGATATLAATTTTTVRTLMLGAGVWSLMGGMVTTSPAITAPNNYFTICISATTSFDNNYQVAVHNSASNIGSTPVLQVTRFVTVASSATYRLIANNGGATNITNIQFQALRIA